MKSKIKCDYCNVEFLRENKEINRNLKRNAKQFCSNKCKNDGKSDKIILNCFSCGNEIFKYKSQLAKSKTLKFYCSSSCSAKVNNAHRSLDESVKEKISKSLIDYKSTQVYPKKPSICAQCGISFYKKQKRNKFCSIDCYNVFRTRKLLKLVSSRTWHKMFKRAFSNWKCPYCDWTETFDIHHIKPRCEGVNNNLDNLVLLCPSHHSLISRKIHTPDDLNDYAVDKFYTLEEFSKFYVGDNFSVDKINKYLVGD